MKIIKDKTITYQEFTDLMMSAKNEEDIIEGVTVVNCIIHSMPHGVSVFTEKSKWGWAFLFGFIPYRKVFFLHFFNGFLTSGINISNNVFKTEVEK